MMIETVLRKWDNRLHAVGGLNFAAGANSAAGQSQFKKSGEIFQTALTF